MKVPMQFRFVVKRVKYSMERRLPPRLMPRYNQEMLSDVDFDTFGLEEFSIKSSNFHLMEEILESRKDRKLYTHYTLQFGWLPLDAPYEQISESKNSNLSTAQVIIAILMP